MSEQTKTAPADGEYLLDGSYYLARKGEPYPAAAKFIKGKPEVDPEMALPKADAKGKGTKAAPETPEGAGPVVETPEDGDTKPEMPEGATE